MTPARKAALEWFYDRGAVPAPYSSHEGRPSATIFRRILKSGQIRLTPEGWTLTDKGRRDLHEAGR
jgi:ribosomal protein S19E (S16A)